MSESPVLRIPVGARRCPICGRPAVAKHAPFCSARCTDIDLGRWLKGHYRVETDDPPEDDTSQDDT